MSILPLRAWEDTKKRKYMPEDYLRTAQSLTILIASWIASIALSLVAAQIVAQLVRMQKVENLGDVSGILSVCIGLAGIALFCVVYGRLRQYSKWYGRLMVLQIVNGAYILLSCFVPSPELVSRAVSLVFTLLSTWLLVQALGQQLRDTRAAGAIQEIGERYFNWTIRYAWFAAGAIVAQAVEALLAEEIAGAFLMIAGLLRLAASVCSIGWLVQYIRYVLQARRHFLNTPKGKKRTAK